MAIQKSNGFTRRNRRNSARSIIPNTTASMMIAARTALGSSENRGASRISVPRTIAPVASEATGVLAPADSFNELAERLVETGMPWNTPAPRLAIPWATDSWLRSTRYRCLVANAWASPAVWENPINSSAKAAMTMTGKFCDTSSSDGNCGKRQAAWHGADQRDAVRAEVEQDRADQAADYEHERAGHLRKPETEPEDDGKRNEPDQERRRAETAEAARPRCELLPGVHAVGGGARELGQLADDDVDRGTGEEAGHDRSRQEAGEPAEFEDGDQQEEDAGRDRDRRHQLGRIDAAQPVTRTAPPATAASDELGPVEMCRDVQKIP